MASTVIDMAVARQVRRDAWEGVDSGLTAADGRKVYLYPYRGVDLLGMGKVRIVFGRKADAKGNPDATGAVVFAACVRDEDSPRRRPGSGGRCAV
ncbi:hypothetical protein [Ramlibacter sp. 2FC]|uniref:hypothetical protein n=1 Tax=Ramlibacter sp. 2FC TaxID=2502188 RepID=UPI0010F83982|nr:hypothetical protein [Ramlibacter sp. 2FC]